MKRTRLIALLAACLFLAALAPRAPIAKAEGEAPIGATLTIEGPDGPVVIPITDAEAARIALFEDFAPPDALDAPSLLRAATAGRRIDYAADPETLLEQLHQAYGAYLTQYDIWLLMDRAQVLRRDDDALADLSTRTTLLLPDAQLRIDTRITATSSDMDVLRVQAYAPAAQPDAERDGILLRNRESSPVRIAAASEGSARLVFIVEIALEIGNDARHLTQSISLPVTVRDDGTPWWQEQLTQPRPSVRIRASDVLGR